MRVGITGGIGSGKSTVCRLFASHGVAAYDSDSAAKRLMNENSDLKAAIIEAFGEESYTLEGLNRKHLAKLVFSDEESLSRLNRLVHPAVREDYREWCREHQESEYVIFESAILFSAGFKSEVDISLAVLAPEELRVERTCRRDGVDRESVLGRMAAQLSDDDLAAEADIVLVNILEEETAEAVEQLHKRFTDEARRY